MSSVQVKENLLTTIVKAPIRVPGTIVHATGATIKLVGSGVVRIGQSMKMGGRKRWVLEDDLSDYLKTHKNVKAIPKKKQASAKTLDDKVRQDPETVSVYDEKDDRAWTDMDSSRSTLGEEEMKEEKNFV